MCFFWNSSQRFLFQNIIFMRKKHLLSVLFSMFKSQRNSVNMNTKNRFPLTPMQRRVLRFSSASVFVQTRFLALLLCTWACPHPFGSPRQCLPSTSFFMRGDGHFVFPGLVQKSKTVCCWCARLSEPILANRCWYGMCKSLANIC